MRLLSNVEAAGVDIPAETFALVAMLPLFGFKGEGLTGLDTVAWGACALREKDGFAGVIPDACLVWLGILIPEKAELKAADPWTAWVVRPGALAIISQQ